MKTYVKYTAVSSWDINGDYISLGKFKRMTRNTKNSVWRDAVTGKSYGKMGLTRARKFATDFFNLPENL